LILSLISREKKIDPNALFVFDRLDWIETREVEYNVDVFVSDTYKILNIDTPSIFSGTNSRSTGVTFQF
jgi:hypothetical protein